ncbi:MAG: hypothetical protein RMJ07_05250 [Nitrososphaerota archaeon]|nr:hypothetical protein [Candidatus Bathyarchaeota archaeon]MDW8049069.1 hypothetical protein [Nitrososphaerota archaeon]
MSISSKLADYEGTKELLDRLSTEELRQLAEKNNIALQREDLEGKVRPVTSREEIVEILVNSEFKESDLINLLGINRLTKEELLNQMTLSQLRQLAKETGVSLEISTFLGTKKAEKKRDMIKALSVLSEQKVREYANKIGLIGKAKKSAIKRRLAKPGVRRTKAKAKMEERRIAKKKVKEREKTAIAKAKPKMPPSLLKEPTQPPPKAIIKEEVPVSETPKKAIGIVEEFVSERIIERRVVRRKAVISTSRRKDKKGVSEAQKREDEAEVK